MQAQSREEQSAGKEVDGMVPADRKGRRHDQPGEDHRRRPESTIVNRMNPAGRTGTAAIGRREPPAKRKPGAGAATASVTTAAVVVTRAAEGVPARGGLRTGPT